MRGARNADCLEMKARVRLARFLVRRRILVKGPLPGSDGFWGV